jgi:hypothetical protein
MATARAETPGGADQQRRAEKTGAGGRPAAEGAAGLVGGGGASGWGGAWGEGARGWMRAGRALGRGGWLPGARRAAGLLGSGDGRRGEKKLQWLWYHVEWEKP